MGLETKIRWTDSTWNPWMGCTKVSEGCRFCYAESLMQDRWKKVRWGAGQPRRRNSPEYWKDAVKWNRAAKALGNRHLVFCASQADWLDREVPLEWLNDLLVLIEGTPALTWQLLTKRPEYFETRLRALRERNGFADAWLSGYAPENVWFGVSVENQEMADRRVPLLVQIPAKIRFLSMEPLLGPVRLVDVCPPGRVQWVIIGGESGRTPRRMEVDWAKSLRAECGQLSAKVFFKQMGGSDAEKGGDLLEGERIQEMPE